MLRSTFAVLALLLSAGTATAQQASSLVTASVTIVAPVRAELRADLGSGAEVSLRAAAEGASSFVVQVLRRPGESRQLPHPPVPVAAGLGEPVSKPGMVRGGEPGTMRVRWAGGASDAAPAELVYLVASIS